MIPLLERSVGFLLGSESIRVLSESMQLSPGVWGADSEDEKDLPMCRHFDV